VKAKLLKLNDVSIAQLIQVFYELNFTDFPGHKQGASSMS